MCLPVLQTAIKKNSNGFVFSNMHIFFFSSRGKIFHNNTKRKKQHYLKKSCSKGSFNFNVTILLET